MRHQVIGKNRKVTQVTEPSDAFAAKGQGQVRGRKLGAFVKGNTEPLMLLHVVEERHTAEQADELLS